MKCIMLKNYINILLCHNFFSIVTAITFLYLFENKDKNVVLFASSLFLILLLFLFIVWQNFNLDIEILFSSLLQ